MLKKSADLIFFGSIFISFCAVALCLETNVLLHLPLNNFYFYLFVFGATLLQYNLHYLFKKEAVKHSQRLAWSTQNKSLHKIFIVSGCLLMLVSLFSFHLRHFMALYFLGIISFLYSFPLLPFTKKRIKDFGLLKITTLALLWTIVTVWFPLDEAHIEGLFFQLIFFRRFLFIFVLCLLFDIRDIEVDRKENISTLAVIVGAKNAYSICYTLLFIFSLLSFIQYIYSCNWVQLAAMLASAIFTCLTIFVTKKNQSDYVYLGWVDGMMLLQAMLVIITSKYLH